MKHLTENPNSEAQNNSEARIPNFETNPNIEARIPKQIRNPKSEIRNSKAWARRPRHAIRNPESGIRNGNIRSYSCNSCSAFRNPKSRIRNAFTMMELMMAIGIFAIGMGLVAGLFPAAVKEAALAVKDYEGPTICQNGLAIVKAKLTHGTVSPLGGSLVVMTTIGDADRLYKTANGRDRGFVALAKQWNSTAGRNDYQIVIIAYDIESGGNIEIVPSQLTGISTIDEAATEFDYTGDKTGLIGSPAIDPASGRYATIIGVDENTIHLDHPIGENTDDPFVIREEKNSTLQDTSPVIGVMMTRTALRD